MSGTRTPAPIQRRRRWLDPIALARGLRVRPKLLAAIVLALAVLLLTPASWSLSVRAILAWLGGAVVYLGLAFRLMSTCTSGHIRARAAAEDETRLVFTTIILVAIASSLAAVVGLIGEAKGASGGLRALYFTMAGLAILASWLVMQVVFTLHYAHDYYLEGSEPNAEGEGGGLRFPGDEQPDYWDFFYFTTSIGATSQTSDVEITSKALRRTVALQAVLSFVFNTAIVALAINLAAGLLA